jgi:two-component system response regulator PilR (NtrC family)
MEQTLVLIVDDEPDICELLEITLARMGLDTLSANDVATAKQLFSEHHFNLCLTDMRLPDGNGLDLLDWIQAHHSNTPVIVITAHGNMEAAIRALKSGAFDFLSKPIDLNNLRPIVGAALKLKPEPVGITRPGGQKLQLLGESASILALKTTIGKLARSQAPVHIHGASGTGKELVARLIHELSARRDHSFVPVNCSAIPTELMESEFFGHLKGSFTGAHAENKGLFVAANGGTLFLDEVAELPIGMQVKLLRAIQERAVRPVGAPAEVAVDVRILSATHKNLEQLIEEGLFRQDLYYRINVIQVDVPGLQERSEDIPILAQHILASIALRQGVQSKSLASDALSALLKYPFPGNVRELENILERAATLSESNTISIADLQLPAAKPTGDTPAKTGNAIPASAETGALDDMLHGQERESIINALEKTRWNKTRAAELLGISFRQLRYRIKKLNIE